MSEKLNSFLCGTESKIGDAAEVLVGEAKSCWCCSFFRGALIGVIVGVLVGLVVGA